MRLGVLILYCPICGKRIRYDQSVPSSTYRHAKFGIICGKQCFDAAEMKYARMILGKDDDMVGWA